MARRKSKARVAGRVFLVIGILLSMTAGSVLAYVKYFRVCALIDKHYDKVCTQYRKHYRILTGRTYWKKYLGMEYNKQGEPEEDKR